MFGVFKINFTTMGYKCDVYQCQSKNEYPLFKLPVVGKAANYRKKLLVKRQRQAWLLALKIRAASKQIRVCGKHFVKGKPAKYDEINDCDWVPSLDLGYRKPSFVPNVEIKLRSSRKRQTENASVSCIDPPDDEEFLLCDASPDSVEFVEASIDENIHAMLENIDDRHSVDDISMCKTFCSAATQTDMTADSIAALETDVQERCCEILALRERVEELSWTEKAFKNDVSKVKFFTGFPNLEAFLFILSYISESLDYLKVKKCSNFQKLLLTLMKLRQNTTFKGLGFRFGISPKEASYIFKNVVVILHDTFPYVVHWPDGDSLRAEIPRCIQEQYGSKVTVIVDCFKVRCEKPSSTMARSQVHPNYKGGPTIKYLIGITPRGFICFISDGYDGGVTNKFITDNCGILENMVSGDVVLADRGFTISKLVAVKHDTLNVPTFTKCLKQLYPVDIKKTRKIAPARLHIDRIIGLLRNRFMILKQTVPITFLKDCHNDKTFFDIIVKTCCILMNLSESVITPDESSSTE